jgi:hypothetical protein
MKLVLDWRHFQENQWHQMTMLMLRLMCGVLMDVTRFIQSISFF